MPPVRALLEHPHERAEHRQVSMQSHTREPRTQSAATLKRTLGAPELRSTAERHAAEAYGISVGGVGGPFRRQSMGTHPRSVVSSVTRLSSYRVSLSTLAGRVDERGGASGLVAAGRRAAQSSRSSRFSRRSFATTRRRARRAGSRVSSRRLAPARRRTSAHRSDPRQNGCSPESPAASVPPAGRGQSAGAWTTAHPLGRVRCREPR